MRKTAIDEFTHPMTAEAHVLHLCRNLTPPGETDPIPSPASLYAIDRKSVERTRSLHCSMLSASAADLLAKIA